MVKILQATTSEKETPTSSTTEKNLKSINKEEKKKLAAAALLKEAGETCVDLGTAYMKYIPDKDWHIIVYRGKL